MEKSTGEVGDEFCRVVMRSNTTLVAASAENVRSVEKLYGKKAIVLESRGGLVAGM